MHWCTGPARPGRRRSNRLTRLDFCHHSLGCTYERHRGQMDRRLLPGNGVNLVTDKPIDAASPPPTRSLPSTHSLSCLFHLETFLFDPFVLLLFAYFFFLLYPRRSWGFRKGKSQSRSDVNNWPGKQRHTQVVQLDQHCLQ